jgi:hypothetical protein
MDKTLYQYFSKTIAAGAIYVVETNCNFLYLISNSVSTAIKIRLNGQSEYDFPAGLAITLKDPANPGIDNPVTQIIFRNPDASSATIAFAISDGKLENNNLQLSGSVTADFTATDIDSGTATATTTAAAVSIATDSAQKEIVLYNNGANTVWVGDSSVDGAAGIGTPILPGDTLILSTTAAVFLHAIGANSQISFNRLRRP